MPPFKSTLEVLKLLDNSNCRECGEKTCMAFAAAVFKGQRKLSECPRVDRETAARYETETENGRQEDAAKPEDSRVDALEKLQAEIPTIDLAKAAQRLGARFEKNRLTLKVMGKDFSVDTSGRLSSEIHVNPWVAAPFLDYVLYSPGTPISGEWVSFRELKEGRERYALFQKRCEEPMKQVADAYPELFDDMVHLFSGKKVDEQFASDIAVVLHPLPLVPLMICYWLPEEGLASSLNVFFDKTADTHLHIGSVFSLGAGLAQMFFRLAQRHGIPLA